MEKISAILLKVHPKKKSYHGGDYIRTVWVDITNGGKCILDVYPDHFASKKFMQYLTPQTELCNLQLIIKNGKKYISGYSDPKFVKIKN